MQSEKVLKRKFNSFGLSVLRFSVSLLALSLGCENSNKNASLADEVQKLTEENSQLQNQIAQSGNENQQLKERIQVLSGLPQGVKAENIYNLSSIKITRYTNLYDKDKDGKKETLIVYIQPIDQNGDVIKAAGDVKVQFWDLNKDAGEALLAEWDVSAEQLREMWFKTLLTLNYRLVFNVSDKLADLKGGDGGLTVKVTFTDHLSGRVFTEQKTIKPRGS
jgi:FtsZ-binding cell division protein ZapB